MVRAANAALDETNGSVRNAISSVRVVKGIWPYADPGRLVGEQLGITNFTTAITRIGGNATYDLVNATAVEIVEGTLDAAIICGAESMRTRRRDKAEGRKSSYLTEPEHARPDVIVGEEVDLLDDADVAAGVNLPVNFYAMADSVIRHRRGESPDEHLARISELWARGSEVAASNPHAWIPTYTSADEIVMPSASNRMVAAPYTKLLTSNINVDQGAALVLCAYEVAQAAGIADDHMVFLFSGAGAYDHLQIRQRDELDQSPAFRLSATQALQAAGIAIDEVDHLDLYSCFPASVQLAQTELDIDPGRPFTITGGLTFAGGPFNGYCTQALAHATELLRGTSDSAFLYGNGGFFSKHSVMVVSGAAPANPYRYSRPQDEVDSLPKRIVSDGLDSGTLEAYTVTYDRSGEPLVAILSILDSAGARNWARSESPDMIHTLLSADAVGRRVNLSKTNQDSFVAVFDLG
jgi:acetyl-CoA C-acetyltransferase